MKSRMIAFPKKKYQIIYADPPWKYNDKLHNVDYKFSSFNHYELQTNKWIASLPVADIADKDCVLFLWVTSPFLNIGIDIINKWGFSYKTVGFCWVKKTINGNNYANLGKWTMGGIELCLIGAKGKINSLKQKNNVLQLVEAQRIKHSQKPDEVRNRIEQLFGNLEKIELFARKKYNGWDAWGNEINHG